MRPGGQRCNGELSRLRRKQTDLWRVSHLSQTPGFIQTLERTGWQVASVGIHRIDPLADSMTGRWVRAAITRIWRASPIQGEGARHEFCGERL
jgi:hypothetical protein